MKDTSCFGCYKLYVDNTAVTSRTIDLLVLNLPFSCPLLRRWLDLEVEGYQRKDKHPEILDEVVEDSHSFWIFRVLHVHQRSDLCRFKRDVRLAHLYF